MKYLTVSADCVKQVGDLLSVEWDEGKLGEPTAEAVLKALRNDDVMYDVVVRRDLLQRRRSARGGGRMMPLTDAEAALLDGCCLVFGTGSRLYGCAEPGSDRDQRGIAAPKRAD